MVANVVYKHQTTKTSKNTNHLAIYNKTKTKTKTKTSVVLVKDYLSITENGSGRY